jgi:hypothetical protein
LCLNASINLKSVICDITCSKQSFCVFGVNMLSVALCVHVIGVNMLSVALCVHVIGVNMLSVALCVHVILIQ